MAQTRAVADKIYKNKVTGKTTSFTAKQLKSEAVGWLSSDWAIQIAPKTAPTPTPTPTPTPAPSKPIDDPLYIGETNWAKLQKQFHPDQLEYATERKGSDIYWRADRHIEDFKYNKSQELDIARQRLSEGTGTPASQAIDKANIAYAGGKSKSELDGIAEKINAGQQEYFDKKEKENGDAITTRYDDEEKDLKTKIEEKKEVFTNDGERPEAPSMVDLYKEFQEGGQGEMYKTTELEDSLNSFKDELRTAMARRDERIEYERSKPVAMGVISGKTSEIEKQEQKNIDFINRQVAYITDQLNTKYNMIETMMNLTQTDFTNASSVYDKEFTQNMQIANYIKGEEAVERSEEAKQQSIASANLLTIIKSMGNAVYAELDDNAKMNIRKLELQAGFPIGFTETLKTTAGEDEILSTTVRNADDGKYIDVLTRGSDGGLIVKSIYAGKVKSTGRGGGSGSGAGVEEIKLTNDEKNTVKGYGLGYASSEMQNIFMNVMTKAGRDLWQEDYKKISKTQSIDPAMHFEEWLEKAKEEVNENPGGYSEQELRKLRNANIDPINVKEADKFLYTKEDEDLKLLKDFLGE